MKMPARIAVLCRRCGDGFTALDESVAAKDRVCTSCFESLVFAHPEASWNAIKIKLGYGA